MKRILRAFLGLAVIIAPLSALAERLEVFRWQALDGKTEQLVSALTEAAKLHENWSIGRYISDGCWCAIECNF